MSAQQKTEPQPIATRQMGNIHGTDFTNNPGYYLLSTFYALEYISHYSTITTSKGGHDFSHFTDEKPRLGW